MSVVAVHSNRAEGRAALAAATKEARLRGCPLFVAEALTTEHGYGTLGGVPERRENLNRLLNDLRQSGVDARGRVLVGTGNRSDLILDWTEELGAELLVVGIRSRTAVGKLLLGSLAQDLLLRADCAVLAVKAGNESAYSNV